MLFRNPKSPRSNLRAGFSLPEVMFAIIIMGIGFIMVAALFPVAIQQTKDSQESTTAATIAQKAFNIIGQRATAANMPSTGSVAARCEPFWAIYSADSICVEDPRFAWSAIYRRNNDASGNPESFATVWIFVASVQNGSQFDTTDLIPIVPKYPNLHPRLVEFQVTAQGELLFRDTSVAAYAKCADGVAANAYIVVADTAANSPVDGRTLRLGDVSATGRTVQPGNDTSGFSATGGLGGTGWYQGWMMGGALVNKANGFGANNFQAPAQDVAVYMSYVRIN